MILVWILLIVWGLWLFMPRIRKWILGKIARKMQQQMYRSMGLDPDAMQQAAAEKNGRRTGSRKRYARSGRKIIPVDYGDYTDFAVLPLTGSEPWLDTKDSPLYRRYGESQMSDAVCTLIK